MTVRVTDWLFKCLRGLMLFSITGLRPASLKVIGSTLE